jgi:WD40 repeat protein
MLVSMAENRRAVVAWSAGVSAVAAAFAAIIASRATTSLSRNAWFVACLVVALIAFAILLAAGVPDIISWLRERKDKPAQHSTLADAQLRDHFEPRARGILPSQVREGSYFTGRVKVLGELFSWLAQSDGADYRARVITGAPGSGKSAVLGRLIGLASPQLRSEWIGSGATGAQLKTALPPGLTATAVHARGLTVDEVAAQISDGLGIAETTAAGLLAALRTSWQPRPSMMVVVDAVDEAEKPYRLIVELLGPVASAASRTRLRLLIGTRRGGGDDLLQQFGLAAVILDLDTPGYLDIADIQEYVRRTLLAEGDAHATTPYRGQPAIAAAVAGAVAARAAPSFLVAQLTALSLTEAAQPIDTTAPGWMEAFPSTVGAAMELYLRDAYTGGPWLRDLLTALAWSQGDGLDDLQLWAAVASELGAAEYSERDVVRLLDSSAADLLHHTAHGDQVAHRLFHEALGEHLRLQSSRHHRPAETHRRLVDVLTAQLPRTPAGTPRWPEAAEYTRMYLPFHAARGQVLDPLLDDAGFLATADPARLLAALPAVTTDRGRLIALTVQRVGQQLLQASPGERACYLEMAARMAGDGRLVPGLAACAPQRPWSVLWAQWDPLDDGRLFGHYDTWVLAVGAVETPYGTVLVSAGEWAIRAWRLADGSPIPSGIPEPPSPISDMVAFSMADEVVVLTLHEGGELRRSALGAAGPPRTLALDRAGSGIWLIWYAGQPAVVTVSQSHVVEVLSAADGQSVGLVPISVAGGDVLTAGNAGGRWLLVAATEGTEHSTKEVVTWDLITGSPVGPPLRPIEHFPDKRRITIWQAGVTERDGKPAVLLGASAGGPVAVWDPVRGDLVEEPYYVGAGVFGVRHLSTPGGDLLCWGDSDGNLFIRVAGASELRRLAVHDSGVQAMTACQLDGDTVIVTGGRDGAVRAWKPGDAKPVPRSRYCLGLVVIPPTEHCQTLIASLNAAGSAQVLDADDGRILAELPGPEGSELRCIARLPGKTPAVVTADALNQLAVWRLPGGEPVQTWRLHADSTPKDIAVTGGNRPVLLAALPDGRLMFVDITTGQEVRPTLTCHDGPFAVVADQGREDHDLLRFITATADGRNPRLWTLAADQASSQELVVAQDPEAAIRADIWAAAFGHLSQQHIVAGAGTYSWLHIWDADDGKLLMRKQLEHAYQMALADVDIAEIAGRTIVLTGGYTCSLVLWPLDTGEEHHLWVGSPLTFIKSLPGDRAVVAGPRGIIAFQLTSRLPGKPSNTLAATPFPSP